MAIKSNLDVVVSDSETEIIESTETVTTASRKFNVGNGEKRISITAWGSNDNQNWEEVESKTIGINKYDSIIMGLNHHLYVKLTGKTLEERDIRTIL